MKATEQYFPVVLFTGIQCGSNVPSEHSLCRRKGDDWYQSTSTVGVPTESKMIMYQ